MICLFEKLQNSGVFVKVQFFRFAEFSFLFIFVCRFIFTCNNVYILINHTIMKKIVMTLMALMSLMTMQGQNPYLPLWEHLPDGEPRVFEDPDNPGLFLFQSFLLLVVIHVVVSQTMMLEKDPLIS